MAVSDDLRILLMRDACREIVELSVNLTLEQLRENRVMELALSKLLENVGEEATKVSDATKAKYAVIPWKRIASTRHRIVHDYVNIKLDVMWDIVTSDVPALLQQLDAIAPEMNP